MGRHDGTSFGLTLRAPFRLGGAGTVAALHASAHHGALTPQVRSFSFGRRGGGNPKGERGVAVAPTAGIHNTHYSCTAPEEMHPIMPGAVSGARSPEHMPGAVSGAPQDEPQTIDRVKEALSDMAASVGEGVEEVKSAVRSLSFRLRGRQANRGGGGGGGSGGGGGGGGCGVGGAVAPSAAPVFRSLASVERPSPGADSDWERL